MIKHVFVFGVIIPTVITIVFFVGFLICWFKFDIHRRFFMRRKKGKKNAFAAHEINSTQKIVEYGQDEEEYDNEKNTEFDRNNDNDDDDDKTPGDMMLNSAPEKDTNNDSSTSRTSSKYVITPSQIEYHYQENLKLTQNGETIEPHNSKSSGNTSCGLCPTIKDGSDGSCGVTNNGLSVSPSMELQSHDHHHPQGELLVQHTFHFPNLAHCEANPKACQMDECQYYGDTEDESDNDNENYGHFVPVSEVIERKENRNTFYKAYGCDKMESNGEDISNLTEHLAPLQEV